MTHLDFAKHQVLKEKYKPKVELLPIQKLTKEEKELGALETLDLENVTQLTAIAKCWINQDRNYNEWVKTCEDYAEVAINEDVNKKFFYKSGIQEALPSVRYFTRKQMNMFFEAIYFDIIPEIISEYEFKRDFKAVRGDILLNTIKVLEEFKSATYTAISNKLFRDYELNKKSIKKSFNNAIVKGYIVINKEATRRFNTNCYVLSEKLEKIDNNWYFYTK